MSKVFAIEFSTVTWFSDDGDEHNTINRFRVLVKDEAVTAYVAYSGPFGDGWARIVDDEAKAARVDLRSCSWSAPFPENRVIALAFAGYDEWRSRPTNWILGPDGMRIIDLGTVERSRE